MISGGEFDVDDKLCHRVFIEADSKSEANDKLIELGGYFNGVEDGCDCQCCGDRWSDYADELVFPYRYSSFSIDMAQEIAEKYNVTYDKTTFKNHFGGIGYDIIFDSVEKYAQYIADNYGSTKPDARIFYKDGKIVEIL